MSIDAKHLQSLERWTLVLGLVTVAAALVAASRAVASGVALGAGLMVLNVAVLKAVGTRLLRAPKSIALLLLNLKMAALFFLVYLAVARLGVDTLGFLIGVSIFPAALLIVAIRVGIGDDAGENPPHGESTAGSARGEP